MDEKRAYVEIASFAHAEQSLFAAGAVLVRGESKARGKVPRRPVLLKIVVRPNDSGSGEFAKAGTAKSLLQRSSAFAAALIRALYRRCVPQTQRVARGDLVRDPAPGVEPKVRVA